MMELESKKSLRDNGWMGSNSWCKSKESRCMSHREEYNSGMHLISISEQQNKLV